MEKSFGLLVLSYGSGAHRAGPTNRFQLHGAYFLCLIWEPYGKGVIPPGA